MKTSLTMEIEAERDRQDKEWGGPSHDDQHNAKDWLRYIYKQITKARKDFNFREHMIKIAALAIAAIESYDRRSA